MLRVMKIRRDSPISLLRKKIKTDFLIEEPILKSASFFENNIELEKRITARCNAFNDIFKTRYICYMVVDNIRRKRWKKLQLFYSKSTLQKFIMHSI